MIHSTSSHALPTPLGTLEVVADGVALHSVRFVDLPPSTTLAPAGLHAHVAEQLDAFLRGARATFDLPLADVGTPFQCRVWSALQDIRCGATTTYGEFARMLGVPASVRAVAAAIARNPWLVIVPCHRVLGAGGALVGYAGGLGRKRMLLELEAATSGLRDKPARRIAA